LTDLISLKLSLKDGDVKAAEDLHEDLLAQQRVYLASRTQLKGLSYEIDFENVE
jgi:hypothetical protein